MFGEGRLFVVVVGKLVGFGGDARGEFEGRLGVKENFVHAI